MSLELTVIEIPPASTHLYTIIWLHGLGADGHDFEDIVYIFNYTNTLVDQIQQMVQYNQKSGRCILSQETSMDINQRVQLIRHPILKY